MARPRQRAERARDSRPRPRLRRPGDDAREDARLDVARGQGRGERPHRRARAPPRGAKPALRGPHEGDAQDGGRSGQARPERGHPTCVRQAGGGAVDGRGRRDARPGAGCTRPSRRTPGSCRPPPFSGGGEALDDWRPHASVHDAYTHAPHEEARARWAGLPACRSRSPPPHERGSRLCTRAALVHGEYRATGRVRAMEDLLRPTRLQYDLQGDAIASGHMERMVPPPSRTRPSSPRRSTRWRRRPTGHGLRRTRSSSPSRSCRGTTSASMRQMLP